MFTQFIIIAIVVCLATLIATLSGAILALIAAIRGYRIVKPYLDRRLLIPARPSRSNTQPLPDSVTI